MNNGDKESLKRNYPMMKRYVDYLIGKSENNLITKGFCYGDWLALDGVTETSLSWGTDLYYNVCIFLCFS